jgi:hypothetical protein
MSVLMRYRAVPPSSVLFQRLLNDKAFVTLMLAFYNYGFSFFDGTSDWDRESTLAYVIESRRQILGDVVEARRLIDEFLLELERTRLAYPGIEERTCGLEESLLAVWERTKEALRSIRDDADMFVSRIMSGDQQLGKGDSRDLEDEDFIGLVSAPLVQEAARVMGELKVETMFADATIWDLEGFKSLRRLYRDAAAHGEALLVAFC